MGGCALFAEGGQPLMLTAVSAPSTASTEPTSPPLCFLPKGLKRPPVLATPGQTTGGWVGEAERGRGGGGWGGDEEEEKDLVHRW